MIDLTFLLISVTLYSAGSLLDNYTTRIFIRDLGPELEANKRVRNLIKKRRYKEVLLEEAVYGVAFGIFDSSRLISSFIFWGLAFLIVRGLTATDNLQKIVEYRIIGIDAYKEKSESQRKALQNASSMNMIKYTLPYLVEALICLAIYGILLTTDFPLTILSRYFVIGLVLYFMITAYYLSRKDC